MFSHIAFAGQTEPSFGDSELAIVYPNIVRTTLSNRRMRLQIKNSPSLVARETPWMAPSLAPTASLRVLGALCERPPSPSAPVACCSMLRLQNSLR